MSAHEFRIVDDVAASFCDVVAEAWRARPGRGFAIALSGGETAGRCYRALAADPTCPVDWMETEVYWGDERCVPPEHPDSNYRLGREALLVQVGGVHAHFPMRCEEGDDPYNLLISTLGQLDVLHLGLGADAHTASLFPDSPALEADPGRLVVRNHDPSGRNRHERMTLTFAGIERARLAVVTVSGAGKADALAAVRRGDDVPASHIRAAEVLWLVDHAAAGETQVT